MSAWKHTQIHVYSDVAVCQYFLLYITVTPIRVKDEACDLCKMVVGYVDNYLKANGSEVRFLESKDVYYH